MINRLLLVALLLVLTCSACLGQISFKELTPGVSTRADVERVLGPPLSKENAYGDAVFEYKASAGLIKVEVTYSGIDSLLVMRIRVYFAPVAREALIEKLKLPKQADAKNINAQGELVEYFRGAGLVLTYASSDATSGVKSIGYYSRDSLVLPVADISSAIVASQPGLNVTSPFSGRIAFIDVSALPKKELDNSSRDALNRFARLNGITRIFDEANLPGLYVVDSSEVTRPFVAFYNGGSSTAPSRLTIPEAKIAVVNSEAFSNERAGIARFNALMTSLDSEFQPVRAELNKLHETIQQLESEIEKTRNTADPATLNQKLGQQETLRRDYQRKTEDAQARYDKRRQEVLGPLYDDVGKALEDFAKKRGFTLVLDSSRLSVLAIGSATDRTSEFISEYNQRSLR